MSLRDVMAFLQKHHGAGGGATSATSEKTMTFQAKPHAHAGCTAAAAATSPFDSAGLIAQRKGRGEPPASAPLPSLEPVDWRALDRTYLAHHAHCHACQAAGRGARYGLRCGVGAALWASYDATVRTPGALPWQHQQQQKGQRHY